MSAQRVLLDVLNRGVQVGADGADLSVRAMSGALTPELRDALKTAKADIIQFIGTGRRLARMSFAQRRMWFIDRLTPGSALYSATAASYRLRGPLDFDALVAAINGVVQRHAVLRTTFPFVNGEPVQSIQEFTPLSVPVYEFHRDADDDRERDALAKAGELVREPFDLARGPLFRPSLIHIADDDHILVLPMHHIINDGWSVGVLYRELRALYEGRAESLPELDTQYADVSEVQHRLAGSDEGARQLAYWKERLGGTLPVLNLVGDRARSSAPEFAGARERLMLPRELAAALKRVGREEGASLFMIGLAAYYALLHRYTGDEDIVIGSPIAGRTAEHSQDLLGLFVNTVALRSAVHPGASMRELIRAVRDTALGAFANQDVPFDHVVADVQPDRDLTHSPLFRVMFVLQNAPAPESGFGDARLTPLELHTGTSKFDLSLELTECEQGIRATLEYNTTLFGEDRARGILGHYATLMHSLSADAEQTVAEIAVISEGERQKLLFEFNETREHFDDTRPVYVRFAEWAARNPQAPAVLWDSGSLTYGGLDRAANALAEKLRHAGIGRNDIVAVCAPRSPEMIVAQLAVLKTGAAYLSLDPEHPFERLKHIVLDAKARALLLHPEHTGQFPNIQSFAIEVNPRKGCAPVEVVCNPADLAYVIYTSGSTGAPKGVAIPHAGLANLASWHQHAFAICDSDRGSQLASPAFDASVWEIWPYLSAGAAVSLCPDDVRAEPAAFRDWLLAERVTVGFAPTDLAESLFALEWPEETALRTLLTGGAWLTKRPPAGLPFTVVNNYGPTENTVVTTSGVVEPGGDTTATPSIGRAIANHHVFVLDDELRLAPLGVPGEMYIGGAGLAREYINDPERTARQFVTGPADAPNPQRLYKTGDRARFLPDGSIQFLGRRDHQVNVRGHRIELAEIEAAAQTHEEVAEAVAMPLEDSSGGPGRDSGLRLFVTPRARSVSGSGGDSQSHVRQWQTLYDETYGEAPINMDPALNVIGWNSSYTGAPIPVDEMREWRDHTVERLRRFKPRRVLEIGCGTGMILAELAGECEQYTAVDFSAEALQYVRNAIVDRRGLRNVELIQTTADSLDALDGQSFDLVILNSIVQYFPSAAYLKSVLSNAVRLVEPGGAVFVGDVRNHALLHPFHTAVQACACASDEDPAAVAHRIRRNAAGEDELLVDPRFFHRWGDEIAAINGTHTLIKRGCANNELFQFRYDAVLFLGGPDPVTPVTIDWTENGSWDVDAHRAIESGGADAVRIAGIPNRRVLPAHGAWEALSSGVKNGTLKNLADGCTGDVGVHPEELLARFEDAPCSAELHCNPQHPERFDLVLSRNGATVANAGIDDVLVETLTNAPLDASRLRGLAASVREYVQRLLPAYMTPNRIVPLASFPRTASGKVDRQALHALDNAVSAGPQYVAPRNELEEAVSAMWSELLGIERIGVEDNFFELGGHSLLATQLVAQLNAAYGVELPLRELFVRPTPAGVAAAVEDALMREIENLTEDEAARLVAS